jgi:hypothetical protein
MDSTVSSTSRRVSFKVNAQVGARHQLHGFFLKPGGSEGANASTDARRFGPSGTTGNGVGGRLYSAMDQ